MWKSEYFFFLIAIKLDYSGNPAYAIKAEKMMRQLKHSLWSALFLWLEYPRKYLTCFI